MPQWAVVAWEHIHGGVQQYTSESLLEGFETSTVGRNET